MIEFHVAIFVHVDLFSFGPPSLAQVDNHMERGGLPLIDAVGVNCKKCATTENQGAGAQYMS